jgi:predicted metal-dependent hydrolase
VIKTNKMFPKFMVDQILERHKDWILKHKKRFDERISNTVKREFRNGEIFTILEFPYTLLIEQANRVNSKVEFIDNSIVVKKGSNESESIPVILEKNLRKSAKEIFVSRAIHYSKVYGLDFENVTVKDQKSKWGSCSTKGNLNFNWKLIFGPKEVLDYVVIHEVCHLKEMNHSDRFWSLVAQQCPDYKAKRKFLKLNGHLVQNAFIYQQTTQ